MKKFSIFTLLTLLFLFVSYSSGISADHSEFKRFVLENEKNLNGIFSTEYETVEDNYSDRWDENGGPISIKDFIRPDETKKLVDALELEKLNLKQKVAKIHSFVRQNFKFVPDEENEDYWQYPNETIKRGKGDCEDLAFLLASMLIAAGVPEELIRVNLKNWHLYTTVSVDGETMILETDPDPSHFYLYDRPQHRWNRQIIEQRKRR